MGSDVISSLLFNWRKVQPATSALHRLAIVVHDESMSQDRLYYLGPRKIEANSVLRRREYGPWLKQPNVHQLEKVSTEFLKKHAVGVVFGGKYIDCKTVPVGAQEVHLHGVLVQVRGYNPSIIPARVTRDVNVFTKDEPQKFFEEVVPHF